MFQCEETLGCIITLSHMAWEYLQISLEGQKVVVRENNILRYFCWSVTTPTQTLSLKKTNFLGHLKTLQIKPITPKSNYAAWQAQIGISGSCCSFMTVE